MPRPFGSLPAVALLLALTPPASAAPPFELRDGDRVVLIGDTLIEREQHSGWVELALTTQFPDHHVTFRNIGWSADTPAGDSRFGLSLLQAGLEPPLDLAGAQRTCRDLHRIGPCDRL